MAVTEGFASNGATGWSRSRRPFSLQWAAQLATHIAAFDLRSTAAWLVDVVLASLILTLLAAPMLVIGLFIWADGVLSDQPHSPILFRQPRIGEGGRRFACWKFRTMRAGADGLLTQRLAACERSRAEWATAQKLHDDPRVTPIGRVLRRYSLDELPQLLNVIRGEMSLVGPRPIVENEIARYGRYFAHYCRVRPGMTGLWQVAGRNRVSYRRRVAMDVPYIRRRGAGLYLSLLAATFGAVAFGSGC